MSTDDWRLVRLAKPSDGDPSWVVRGVERIERLSSAKLLGTEDMVQTASELVGWYRPHETSQTLGLVALLDWDGPDQLPSTDDPDGDPDRVVGYGWVEAPQRDNTHLAEFELTVHPDHEFTGGDPANSVERALVEYLEGWAADRGRTTVLCWTSHRDEAAPNDLSALRSPGGPAALPADDPQVLLMTGCGYQIGQTERHSLLELPLRPGVLDGLYHRVEGHAEGYQLVQWVGATPAHLRGAMARLKVAMSTDVPKDDLDLGEEVWDDDRVAALDERLADRGWQQVSTAVRHLASGDLVAFTTLVCTTARPEMAQQYETLVRADHRGHRLGWWIKAANVEQLATTHPRVHRVHTWNAGENRWMLAINEAMGFERVATAACWQKKS